MPSSSTLRHVLTRNTNYSILPIPPRTTGNNVPKSLHKTRRDWQPNVSRMNMHVNLPGAFTPKLGESSTPITAGPSVLKGVKIQTRRKKDVEKAGGLEGLLLSRPAKDFTPFGQQIRSALFEELHRIRAASKQDTLEKDTSVNDATPFTPTTPTTSVEEDSLNTESIPTGPGR